MIPSHLLLTLRTLKGNLLYTVLVIAGLAIGITTFLATIQWSAWHMSFDRNIPAGESVYRLTFEEINDDFYRHTARILHGDILNRIVFAEGIAGIEQIGRLAPFRKAAFHVEEDVFYEEYAFACDPEWNGMEWNGMEWNGMEWNGMEWNGMEWNGMEWNGILQIFKPGIIRGSRTGLLEAPSEAVLTASAAERFFGSEDPLGKSIEVMHQFDVRSESYTVTAVIADFPTNSHLKISVLTSFTDPMEYSGTGWTYARLSRGSDVLKTQEDLNLFISANFEEEYARKIHARLQPVSEIHLYSHLARELRQNVHFRTVLILIISGMLVFLLAWFNFTLLSFSQNQLHVHRLVVQWQMGAGKQVFLRQFLAEHLLVGMAAFAAGILLTLAVAPAFDRLGGDSFSSDPFIFIRSVLLLVLFILITAFVTAAISTERLYRFLQRKFLSKKAGAPPDATGRNLFIRAVIVLEFMITFVLVSNLLLISMQIRFAMGSQLGSQHPEAIHIHNLHRTVVDKYGAFKEQMEQSPHIDMVTASMEEPTRQTMDANTFEINGVDEGDKQLFLYVVDEDFIRFYDLDVLYGRDFPVQYDPADSIEYFCLNETAARMITGNPEQLIGSELNLHFSYPGFIWPGRITTIVRDFHISGLENEIAPMVIFPKYTWLYCFSLLPAGETGPAIRHLEMVWEEMFPDFPLEYQSSEELIESLHETELVQTRVLTVFGILSLVIAGMGLFAFSGLFMQRKVRLAAIRKISGARLHQIIIPELRYYLWLALLSSLLAFPVSYLLLERWMRNFHYRVEIPWWVFPACGLMLVIFSWLAVLYHTARLARTNPIEFTREQ